MANRPSSQKIRIKKVHNVIRGRKSSMEGRPSGQCRAARVNNSSGCMVG